jgi:hypothetical protein
MACRYSAAIHLCDGNDDQDACGDVLIACGTVFNHILLWAPFRMPDRLLCDYVGHEVCALTHSHTPIRKDSKMPVVCCCLYGCTVR